VHSKEWDQRIETEPKLFCYMELRVKELRIKVYLRNEVDG